MNKIIFTLSVSICAFLVGCNTTPHQPDPASAPLVGAKMGGPFTLTDQNGKIVSDRQFNGKYRMVYFGYSFCPDVCPVDVQVLSQGLLQFEKLDPVRGAKVQPIFVTVDPKRDTPAVLKTFVANFHPRLIGLTGSQAQIDAVAKTFAVIFEYQKPNETGSYLVDHSRTAVLYGPEGQPLALLPQDQNAKAVSDELARWVR
jgi:protein SCO1